MKDLIQELANIDWRNDKGLVKYSAMKRSKELLAAINSEWMALAKETGFEMLDNSFDADRFMQVVSEATGREIKEIKSKSRVRELVDIRTCCMAILSRKNYWTLKRIGQFFGGRDHTTAVHALNKHRSLVIVDETYRELFNKISDAYDYYCESYKEVEQCQPA